MASHDLSEYELLRLENIRRNNEFLASLGIQQHKPPPVVKKEVIKQIKIPKRELKAERVEPERSSKRIKGLTPVKYDDVEVYESKPPPIVGVNYETVPEESDQLDDFEFEAFVEIRKWRLYRMRELQIEPYKIFPNKTLCQLIRYRRNDASWASDRTVKIEGIDEVVKAEASAASPVTKHTSGDNSAAESVETAPTEEDNDSLKNVTPTPYNEAIARDLLQCFGIGPSKVKADGFAWEALAVLNKASVAALLDKSKNSIKSELGE